MKGKSSVLEADIDDVYQILLRFESGVFGNLGVDVVSRVQYRDLKVLCQDGVALWDWQAKRLSIYRSCDKQWQQLYPTGTSPSPSPEEQMYVDEMRYFIEVARGEQTLMYSLSDDKRMLGLLYAAENSSDRAMHINLG